MKSVKYLASALLVSASSLLAAGEVNLYSHRHYDTDRALYKTFEAQTGIKVNVVHAKAEELLARLKIEGANSPADVFITADVGNLYDAKAAGVLQSITSKTLNDTIPAHLRDKDGQWYGLTKRARVIVYNKEKVDPATLSTFEALGEKDFPYTIAMRTSANAYNKSLIGAMIAHHGEAGALTWAKGVVANMARAPKGNDRDQIRAAASGEADIAVANTYYVGRFVTSSDPADRQVAEKVGVFFPNQNDRGTHINISGAGVTVSSKNKENAIKLLEFLVSPEAQENFAHANFEYPINPAVQISPVVKAWGEFKEDTLPLSAVGENGVKSAKIAQEAQWK
ncbi:MAG: Fe(3+) ABC transporter substrate-binding protein [Campylobacterales bacterium]|nr:Fe(3+) ABC transporter substrate-binding protein [Campylobacterales bacterium]